MLIGGKFTANTKYSEIPDLTDEEFEKAKAQADKNGYTLIRYTDEPNTTTYSLTPYSPDDEELQPDTN